MNSDNNNNFDTYQYWQQRLISSKGKKGVGCLAFSENYNNYLYRSKLDTLNLAICKHDMHPTNILDIGSGTGIILDYFKQNHNPTLNGVELTKIGADLLRSRFPEAKIMQTDISKDKISFPKKFDVVSVMDVIYHIVDDIRFDIACKNICSNVCEGGYVLISECLNHSNQNAPHVRFRDLSFYLPHFEAYSLELVDVLPMYYLLNREYLRWIGPKIASHFGGVFYIIDKYLKKSKTKSFQNTQLLVAKRV